MSTESMVTQAEIEDLGRCVGCNQLLRVGEVVTPWDDEVGHYDCNNPSSLERVPELDADPDCPPPFVLLGSPAQYVPLDKVRAAWNTRTAAQPEREAVLEELNRMVFAPSSILEIDDYVSTITLSQHKRIQAALATPAPAVSRDEIVAAIEAVLARWDERLANELSSNRDFPWAEDDEWSVWQGLRAILSRIRGEGE